jgi:TolB-like protein/DNA-binding winged helix-turn-helix (wHTH) protein/Flp pilus assembly protein TadD
MDLLILLVERRGELVSRGEIAERLWGKGVFLDVDHGINTAMRKVRRALRDDPDKPRFVETVVGRGYRFAAPVIVHDGDSSLPPPPLPLPAPAAATLEIPTEERRAFPVRRGMLLAGAATLALLAVAFVLGRGGRARGDRPAIKSLAVLPLKNVSGDPAQDYFADGVTEAVIARLSTIHGLRVISRTSVMRFKDSRLSAPEIARTLGVDALVEGSVIRDGGRVRVNAQLILGASNEHFWSETYDRELEDALALEGDVAQSIARRVEVTVTGEERARLVAARPVAPEVYETYLKGQFARDRNSKADIEKSIAWFGAASRMDPTFAPAFVGLAGAYVRLGTVFVGVPPEEVRPKAIGAARKALELDPEVAEAHALLADVYQRRWQWREAESEYERALELNPNDATAHLGFAGWLLCQGRTDEALAWSRRARELDPLGDAGTTIGWILFHARHYDEAIRELRSDLAVRPDSAQARWYLGFALIGSGRPEEAIPQLEKTVSLTDHGSGAIGLLASACAHAGRRPEALRLLQELKDRERARYVPAGAFINAYLGLGDYEEAFAWFDRAYQEKSNILQFLRVHPFFDPVRSDPRFRELVHRVGLDRAW